MAALSFRFPAKTGGQVFGQLDFKLVVETSDSPAFTVVLLAPSRQEKAAWTSDISQVVGSLRQRGLVSRSLSEEQTRGLISVLHMYCKIQFIPCYPSHISLSLSVQCIDNIRCNGLMTSVFEENSKVTVPHMIK